MCIRDRPGSPGYYALLAGVAIFILGPLGGVTAAYMNFSLGFFIGGQVLAGILGSVVTLWYGPDGKHGANYMQTMAASVSGMAAMGVLIQAMVWLGMPEPPAWQLIQMCIRDSCWHSHTGSYRGLPSRRSRHRPGTGSARAALPARRGSRRDLPR